SPLDLTLGTLSFFNAHIPDPSTDLTNFYEAMTNLIRIMRGMGMDFYQPVEVAGYPAYHQFPLFNRNWISTNYLTRRYDFIRKLMTTMNKDEPDAMYIDILSFIKNTIPEDIASDAKALIMKLAEYL